MSEKFEGNLPPQEQKGEITQPPETGRKKFEGAPEWGDLVHLVDDVSKGIDDLTTHAERIFRTYDMGSPFASKKMDLEILKRAGEIVKEMKDRIEMKGHY